MRFSVHNTRPRSVREGVAARITSFQAKYPRFQPQLAIVQAGERPDSTVYVRMKAKAAEEVGIKFHHVSLPAASTVEDVIATVKHLNEDEKISGILVQLPLGEHVTPEGERLVTEAVSPEKDIDGSVVCPTLMPEFLFCAQIPCLQHRPSVFARL